MRKNVNYFKTNEKGNGLVAIIIILVTVALFIGIAKFMFSTFNKTGKSMMDHFYKESEEMSEEFKRDSEAMEEESNKFAFNSSLKYMQGTQSQFTLSQYLDKVVTSNKTNKEHLIEVTYNEITSTEEADIVAIKHSLKDGSKYEVSVDYAANGYINKVTIKDI